MGTNSRRKVLIWTEGGKKIGMGHIMRCLPVAASLRDAGTDVSFRLNSDESAIDAVTGAGYEIIPVTGTREAKLLYAFDAVVFDVKSDVSEDVLQFTKQGAKVVFIDNLTPAADRAHRVIIPSLLKTNNSRGENPERRVLRGIEYFPLNHEFVKAGSSAKEPRGGKLRILVSMGGADPNNITIKVVRALEGIDGIELKVVAGPSMSVNGELHDLLRPNELIFKADVKKMAMLMRNSDIAFTAFGITLYELAYMGVPSIIIANYREDKKDMDAFDKRGAGMSLGYHEDVTDTDIRDAVALFLQNNDMLENMIRHGRDLVDGRGAGRIADVIQDLIRLECN